MPEVVIYNELQQFPHVRAWAEEVKQNPTVTMLAFMGSFIGPISRGLGQAMAEAHDAIARIPVSVRRKCFRDSRWMFQHYLWLTSAMGLPGLTGANAVSSIIFGAMPVGKVLHCLRLQRLPQGQSFAFLPLLGPSGGNVDAEVYIAAHADDLTTMAGDFTSRFADAVTNRSPTADMNEFSRWLMLIIGAGMRDAMSANGGQYQPVVHDMSEGIQQAALAATDFWQTIMMPCLLAHGEPPAFLYRRALNGDDRAWRHLVAMDASILGFPEFAGRLLETRRRQPRQALATALADGEDASITPRELKLRAMGRIIRRTRAFGGTLDRPKMQRLMNAIHRDLSGGAEWNDPDVGSMDDDTLRKAVTRALASESQ